MPQATCVDRVAVGRTSRGEQCDWCQPLFPVLSALLKLPFQRKPRKHPWLRNLPRYSFGKPKSVPGTFRYENRNRCQALLELFPEPLFPAFGDGGGEVGSEADEPKSWTTPWSNGQHAECRQRVWWPSTATGPADHGVVRDFGAAFMDTFGSDQEPPRRSVPATFRRRSVPATFRWRRTTADLAAV